MASVSHLVHHTSRASSRGAVPSTSLLSPLCYHLSAITSLLSPLRISLSTSYDVMSSWHIYRIGICMDCKLATSLLACCKLGGMRYEAKVIGVHSHTSTTLHLSNLSLVSCKTACMSYLLLAWAILYELYAISLLSVWAICYEYELSAITRTLYTCPQLIGHREFVTHRIYIEACKHGVVICV